ncbi:uncharacterized protein DS421_17g597400 [Arachis hypogaea]|nr:uncharacterized protein DS421_17g597400 [Arachis hypogaea]
MVGDSRWRVARGSHGGRASRVKESLWIRVVDHASRMGTWHWLRCDGWRPRWCLMVQMRWDYDPAVVEAAMSNEEGRRRDARKRPRSATKDAVVVGGRRHRKLRGDSKFVQGEI